MSEHDRPATDGAHYQIRVRGQLDPAWAEWLHGLQVTWDSPCTSVLTGRVRDQAVLHSVLARLYDLGLPLLAVTCGAAPPPRAAARRRSRRPDRSPGPRK